MCPTVSTANVTSRTLILIKFTQDGMSNAGTKVRVCGSELIAGSPSDVLEASRQCFLHLHFNGCHR